MCLCVYIFSICVRFLFLHHTTFTTTTTTMSILSYDRMVENYMIIIISFLLPIVAYFILPWGTRILIIYYHIYITKKLQQAPRPAQSTILEWILLGHALGWVNSKIILGFVFIVVLHPIAFIMRLTGYDPLRTRRTAEKTFRENRKKHKIDFTRIF